jgi:uncharacterized membrane protein YphA (DoxX/SURF4 family)
MVGVVSTLPLVSRFVLAAVFVPSGVAKLVQLDAFERAGRGYRLLRPEYVRPFARTLPFVEVSAGALLAIGFLERVAGALLVMLLLVFAIAIAVNLGRGRIIDCGCMTGPSPRRIGWSLVIRDLALAGAALSVVWFWPRSHAADSVAFGGGNGLSTSDSLAILAATLSSLLIVALTFSGARLNRLTDLPR